MRSAKLTLEESERLEAHKTLKKITRKKLVRQTETNPAAAAEPAKKRAYASEATKKSWQKMYEEAAAEKARMHCEKIKTFGFSHKCRLLRNPSHIYIFF